MLRISEIKLDLDCDFHDIEEAAAKTLKVNKNRFPMIDQELVGFRSRLFET